MLLWLCKNICYRGPFQRVIKYRNHSVPLNYRLNRIRFFYLPKMSWNFPNICQQHWYCNDGCFIANIVLLILYSVLYGFITNSRYTIHVHLWFSKDPLLIAYEIISNKLPSESPLHFLNVKGLHILFYIMFLYHQNILSLQRY